MTSDQLISDDRRRGTLVATAAEVRVAEGEPDAAFAPSAPQALPLARASMVANHLMQRIFGTMILAAPDPLTARVIVIVPSRRSAGRRPSVLFDCHVCRSRRRLPAHGPATSSTLDAIWRSPRLGGAVAGNGAGGGAGGQAEVAAAEGSFRCLAAERHVRMRLVLRTSSNGPGQPLDVRGAGMPWPGFDVLDGGDGFLSSRAVRVGRCGRRGVEVVVDEPTSTAMAASAVVIPLSSREVALASATIRRIVNRSSIGCGLTCPSRSRRQPAAQGGALRPQATEASRSIAETVVLFPAPMRRCCFPATGRRGDVAGRPTSHRVLDVYRGELLSFDPYEDWVFHHRQRLQFLRHRELLRSAGRFEQLVASTPPTKTGMSA